MYIFREIIVLTKGVIPPIYVVYLDPPPIPLKKIGFTHRQTWNVGTMIM
jgi:hypothetical protein